MLRVARCLELLENYFQSATLVQKLGSMRTYNKLLKSSMQFRTAFDSKIIAQTLVNGTFFHRAFGMSAGLLCLSWCRIQMAKAGMSPILKMRSVTFAGFLMCSPDAESMLKASVTKSGGSSSLRNLR